MANIHDAAQRLYRKSSSAGGESVAKRIFALRMVALTFRRGKEEWEQEEGGEGEGEKEREWERG